MRQHLVSSGDRRSRYAQHMSQGVNIVLAGGGTAGHVNPLLAIAKAIDELDSDASITVIGTETGLEHTLVPQAGYPLETIEKVPFPRSITPQSFAFPVKLLRQVHRVKQIIAQAHADVVVGVGGYASAPAYIAAHQMGLPLVIHEQNARAGMANKLGARWAQFVGTVYEHTGLQGAHGATICRVGLPLRPAIAEISQRMQEDKAATRIQAATELGVDPKKPIVLITGGSLGAQSLNMAVANCAQEILQTAQVIHLTGKGKDQQVRTLVEASAGDAVITGVGSEFAGSGDYHIAPYLERIDLAFACADLVICRAGAGTCAELAALGVPAVYVPLPIGNGEQRYNAAGVVDAGGGVMIADREFTSEWVAHTIPALLADHEQLQKMSARAFEHGIRDAAQSMAEHIVRVAKDYRSTHTDK